MVTTMETMENEYSSISLSQMRRHTSLFSIQCAYRRLWRNPYRCEPWPTRIFAKYVHNVNGNPEGVYPAQGTATVLWPDGNVNVTANTTPDGLAIFPVSTANKSADLYKIILVTIAFQGPQGVPPCDVTVDRAAFFTLVIASPTGSATGSPTPTVTGTVTPTDTPIATPSPTPCPTPINRRKTPTPCP